MKIAVTASGSGLDAPTSSLFGRCQAYVLVDTETLNSETVPNPALSASGGAGIQAAQYLVEREVQALVTGNVGPNAFQVLEAAGIPVYLHAGGTVRQAMEGFRAGQLEAVSGATAPSHAGLGGRGHGGRGMGRGGRRP
jgi:predicted Fe-Mo cluster-binding NifX family protein